ncbi:MAG: hypothetical protein AABO41_27300 [Acidobacteriota bacterium]
MSKKSEKSAEDLERIAQDKISAIRRIVLDPAGQGGSINGAGMRSREIETVVFESLRVRKALKRVRRTQARQLRKAERAR